jgi:hypothetical protein
LTVETPDGAKTGSNVVEVALRESHFLESGLPVTLSGEALYLDLGPGRKPLVALLRDPCRDYECRAWREDQLVHWSNDNPSNLLIRLYGDDVRTTDDLFTEYNSLAKGRKPVALQPMDLPVLATFQNVDEPNSVRRIDPNDLAASLGPGVHWRSMTIETTNEPITTGIEKKLPWLKRIKSVASHGDMRLDGEQYGFGPTQPKYSFANSLTGYDFER